MIALLLALIALFPVAVRAESVTWLMFDAPPMYIRSGPLANQGSSDKVVRLLSAALPRYEHKLRPTVFARAWYDIEHEDGVCMVGAAQTAERERIAKFSRAIYNSSGNRLIALKAKSERFAKVKNADGRIDLSLLGAESDLRGAFAPKRSYGPSVSRFINQSEKKVTLESVPNEYQLFNLLTHDRIDYFFAYGAEVQYYRQIYNIQEPLTLLPVAGDDTRIDAHVACSKQPLGSAIIADIEALLSNPAFAAQIQAARGGWEALD